MTAKEAIKAAKSPRYTVDQQKDIDSITFDINEAANEGWFGLTVETYRQYSTPILNHFRINGFKVKATIHRRLFGATTYRYTFTWAHLK